MGTCIWEEIHGFQSLGEYQKYVLYIEGQVQTGYAIEITPLSDYHKDFVFGGRWFEDIDSGQKWRLVPPDFPFRGLWDPVKL